MPYKNSIENVPVLTVSELVDVFNAANAEEVVVEGEINRIDVRQGTLVFISIKDAQSTIDVFGLTYRIRNLDALQEGMLVRVYGVPGLYKKSGRFRLDAKAILPTGEGALRIAFEKLKLKLELDGLFDLERKRKLERFPNSIALVTAPKSQAYNDFVKVLRERFGGISIDFYPVQVQGMGSESQIVSALRKTSTRPYDAVVLVRGGGSIEDLHAFNSEDVARAVFASKNPVICGVGHEGDISLADLVADVRASTPSNAAELLVPERTSVARDIDFILHSLSSTFVREIHEKRERVREIAQGVAQSSQVVVDSLHSLVLESSRVGDSLLAKAQVQLLGVTEQEKRIKGSWQHQFELQSERTQGLAKIIASYNYENVLKRGYSILTKKDGTIVSTRNVLAVGDEVSAKLSDGVVETKITKI